MDSAELAPSYHRLFPAPDNAPDDWAPVSINEVAEIKVWHRANGRRMLIPGPFGAHDLPDETTFYSRFGGGSYELVAYRMNGQVYRRRSIDFPGPPSYAVNGAPASTTTALPVAAAPSSALASAPVIAAAITATVTLVTAWMAHSRELGAREEAQRQAMLTMLVNGGNAGNQQMTELLKTIIAHAPAAAPAAPAPSLVDQLKAVEDLKKAVKSSGITEDPEWLRAVEAIGPTALQTLAPILLAKFLPGGMPPMPPMPIDEPPRIRVVPA